MMHLPLLRAALAAQFVFDGVRDALFTMESI
jgi:hypothetical protein